jgi:hypothetical protein
MQRIVVVLPQPLGPRYPYVSPERPSATRPAQPRLGRNAWSERVSQSRSSRRHCRPAVRLSRRMDFVGRVAAGPSGPRKSEPTASPHFLPKGISERRSPLRCPVLGAKPQVNPAPMCDGPSRGHETHLCTAGHDGLPSGREQGSGAGASSPLSSRACGSLPLRRASTPSARRRSATWRLRRDSPCR